MYSPQTNQVQMKMSIKQPKNEFLPASIRSLFLPWDSIWGNLVCWRSFPMAVQNCVYIWGDLSDFQSYPKEVESHWSNYMLYSLYQFPFWYPEPLAFWEYTSLVSILNWKIKRKCIKSQARMLKWGCAPTSSQCSSDNIHLNQISKEMNHRNSCQGWVINYSPNLQPAIETDHIAYLEEFSFYLIQKPGVALILLAGCFPTRILHHKFHTFKSKLIVNPPYLQINRVLPSSEFLFLWFFQIK